MKTISLKYLLIFVLLLSPHIILAQASDFDKPLTVDDVNFKFKDGNDEFNESSLSSILFTKSGDQFNYDELVLDMQRIEKFYFDNGYFDARVDTAFTYNNDTTEISIDFIITQNKPYRINNVEYF